MGDDPMALLGLEGALKHYYYYVVDAQQHHHGRAPAGHNRSGKFTVESVGGKISGFVLGVEVG